MNSINDIWASVLAALETQLTSTAIATWFADCTPVDITEGTFVIHLPKEFKREIITSRYSGIVEDVLRDLFACELKLQILVGDELAEYNERKKDENSLPEMDGYTFENFIVGNSNKFAHAAALGVVDHPGDKRFNPLFIYGNSGLGKTHLLLAIGSAIHEKDHKAQIAYVKGDEFTNEMILSIRNGTTEEFRQKYRKVDLLLVDDIQFIAGKESTQQEFFHTFNSIYEAGHQIVITSDRPPDDMPTLDDRLRTRFQGALMAKVEVPDLETRIAIIRNKSGQLAMILPDDVIQYIAENVTNNVRQLEGVVKRLSAYRDLENGEITVESVQRTLSELFNTGMFVPTPDMIIEETARYYSITSADIRGQKRNKNIAMARHVSMYLIRMLTNLSLNDIGSHFGDRNHATVLASITKIEESVKTDKDVASTVRDITSNINSRQR